MNLFHVTKISKISFFLYHLGQKRSNRIPMGFEGFLFLGPYMICPMECAVCCLMSGKSHLSGV